MKKEERNKPETRKAKRSRFSVFGLLFFVSFLSGCVSSEYNLATGQTETYFYSTDREVAIGHSVSRKIERHYADKIVHEVDVNERVQRIMDSIVEVSDRQDIVYFIKVIDEDIVNAVSLPGGYIYLFKGLMDKIDRDDQLAGVIAHEVAHITARHGIKRLQASYGAMLLQIASISAGGKAAAGVNFALTAMFTEYSQHDEFEADRLAVKYLRGAGYDPQGMVEMLEILDEAAERRGPQEFSYWKTHPNISKRIAATNQAIKGRLEFRDYINLMDQYE